MPDPIIPYTPFGTIPGPGPIRLDRDLDANGHKIINVDWTGDPINLSTDVTGLLPLSNLESNIGPYLVGRDSTGSPVRVAIGSNITLTGNTLAAQAGGGGGLGDFSTNTSTSVVDEIVLFSNTGGKQGKRSTGSGRPKLTSGVMSLANVSLTSEVTGVLPAANVAVLPTANIADLAVTNAKLAGGITASNLVGSDITTVGTITSGGWAGTTIGVSYGGTSSATAAGARSSLNIESVTGVGDADYSMTDKDRTVVTTAALTAPRTWTLPPVAQINQGTRLVVADNIGGVTATNSISIAPAGVDTINGAGAPFTMNRPYDILTFTVTGAGKWTISGSRPVINKSFSSNQTYTTPVGVKAIYVECVGGGGAGGGGAVSSSNLSLGSGGGGGAYSAVYIASPSASYLITIGAGGTPASGANGGSGADTTFGAVCSAQGGGGGTTMAAGTASAIELGALAGTGTIGDVQVQGEVGGRGIRLSGSVGCSGRGGTSGRALGGGGRERLPSTSGAAGGNFGSGGSGGITTAAANSGGAGASGICLVTEYY